MPTIKKNGYTTFICKKSDAGKVYLAGDFNGWDPSARRMVKVKGGTFRARMNLDPGEHEYKFVVDGEWRPDPECEAKRSDGFGSYNSVVRV